MSRFVRARPRAGIPPERGPGPVGAEPSPRWRRGLIRERIRSRREAEIPPPPPEASPAEETVSGPFEARRGPHRPPPAGKTWGPEMRLGPALSLRAAQGHRAAVIELRPGLFLVAEVPEATLEGEFGAAGLLAPLIIQSAVQALRPSGHPGAGPGAPPQGAPPQSVTAQILSAPATVALVNHAVQTATTTEPDPWAELEGAWPAPAPYLLAGPTVPVLPGLPVRWADPATVAGALGYGPPAPWRRS